ncbi:hypothetical protein J6590_079764 [Homalodisca vitripennis]|nr:hypothetical protein J6590_079764 [Homalodisca vitripennis]
MRYRLQRPHGEAGQPLDVCGACVAGRGPPDRTGPDNGVQIRHGLEHRRPWPCHPTASVT